MLYLCLHDAVVGLSPIYFNKHSVMMSLLYCFLCYNVSAVGAQQKQKFVRKFVLDSNLFHE